MKIKDTIIVINSSLRPMDVKTHILFPSDVIDWVVAMPTNQWDYYIKHIPAVHTLAIPHDVPEFLSSQRQWVMEHFTEYKYIWLMDDDLTFFRRNKKLKLKKCKEKHVKEMFEKVRKHLDTVPVVGVSTRLGNNRVMEDYDEINRVTRCYAINTETFKDVGATFAPFEPFLAQDFHMMLCFLNKGYANRILYTYAQEDSGSNADGGCSSYRNQELQKKVSFWMADNHPEVSVKAKSSKNWKGYEGARVDMTVQWKKAYKPKKVRASGGLNALFDKK